MRVPGRIGRARSQAGFTLTELMIVVVILGLLAGIASVGYRKYIGRARVSEAAAVLAEMVSKEQLYFMEFGAYLPLRADDDLTLPSPNENASAFYPLSADSTALDSARTATSIVNAASWPASWRNVGLRPKATALYCTYMANAGPAGTPPPAGTMGVTMLNVTATAPAWFYALAACNFTGTATYPAGVTLFGLTSDSPSLRTFNEGQ